MKLKINVGKKLEDHYSAVSKLQARALMTVGRGHSQWQQGQKIDEQDLIMSSPYSYSSYTRTTPQVTPKPEAGVAEWSKKIREMQQQVDLDEEQETKILEAEIAASRLARASRRNTLNASPGGVSLDAFADASSGEPAAEPASDKLLGRSDALRKLVAQDDRSHGTTGNKMYDYSAVKANVPGSSRAPTKGEAISLAAFMGGTASGPRLNKVAPEPEYNPDLYAPQPQMAGAHPIFGKARDHNERGNTFSQTKKGIPLPGMGNIRKTSPNIAEPVDVPPSSGATTSKWDSGRSISPLTSSRPRFMDLSSKRSNPDLPGASSPPQNNFQSRPTSESKPFKVSGTLQSFEQPSEKSSPGFAAFRNRNTFQAAPPQSAVVASKPRAITPEPSNQVTTPWSSQLNQTTQPTHVNLTHSHSPERPARNSYDDFGTPSPNRTHAKSIDKPPISPKPIVSSPPLARAIQPDVKSIRIVSPSVPTGAKPSPAFLKTPAQKELTPSLSRLQGRGFVEQRVKASVAIESVKEVPSSPNTSAKKPKVLSRWPPASTSTPDLLETEQQKDLFPESPTRPRHISAMEREREAGIFPRNVSQPTVEQSRRPPGAIPLPSLAKKTPTAPPRMIQTPQEDSGPRAAPVALPGLGSSSTMISYVRSHKTGQSEPDSTPEGRGGVVDMDTVAPVLTHVREPYQTLGRSTRQ